MDIKSKQISHRELDLKHKEQEFQKQKQEAQKALESMYGKKLAETEKRFAKET